MVTKVEVVDDPRTEANEADMVVCHRITDIEMPMAIHAAIGYCRDCKQRVWVAPSSPTKPPKVCIHCAKIAIAKSDDKDACFMVSKEARADKLESLIKELSDKEEK